MAKNANEPYDSRALVKQLQQLWLNDDDELEQILTSDEPEALSHLLAAHTSKSKFPLVAEKDGRVFFVLAGSSAYSNWAGQYPMEFTPATKLVRKLSDPTLADEEITTYQGDALKEVLAAVRATDDAVEFREPVQVLRPEIWDSYKAVIAEPVDLGTMQHMLHHSRYATMSEFWRHIDLLEENDRKYNGNCDASVVTAATKVRSDIYRRLDEIPAEPPLGQHGGTPVRRIIYADDRSGHSAAGSAVGALQEEGASRSKAVDWLTDNPTFFLPLGRLGVARKEGDEEVIPTPYIVVMGLESSYKPLWLYKDDYTAVGLPSDKKALLDFGGQYNFTMAKLADDIDELKPLPGCGGRDSHAKRVPTLRWGKVQDYIRKTSQDKSVLFDIVDDQQQATAAIEEGWDRSTYSSQRARLNNFVVSDDNPALRDSDDHSQPAATRMQRANIRRIVYTEFPFDNGDKIDESWPSDDSWEPPKKRLRPASSARGQS